MERFAFSRDKILVGAELLQGEERRMLDDIAGKSFNLYMLSCVDNVVSPFSYLDMHSHSCTKYKFVNPLSPCIHCFPYA